MCLIVSTFLVFRQVCWSVVTRGWVSLAVLSNSCQKNTMADFCYKSLKPWKIDNIDLTQQFSASVFTDFRYQSIKITWLLPIFIDWLATPGGYLTSLLQEYCPPRSLRSSSKSLLLSPLWTLWHTVNVRFPLCTYIMEYSSRFSWKCTLSSRPLNLP